MSAFTEARRSAPAVIYWPQVRQGHQHTHTHKVRRATESDMGISHALGERAVCDT